LISESENLTSIKVGWGEPRSVSQTEKALIQRVCNLVKEQLGTDFNFEKERCGETLHDTVGSG